MSFLPSFPNVEKYFERVEKIADAFKKIFAKSQGQSDEIIKILKEIRDNTGAIKAHLEKTAQTKKQPP